MSSARLPEHGGLPPIAAAPGTAPAPDAVPVGLLPAPTPELHTTHLVPCAGCGALNGRSALVCWSCEADLLALAPFPRPLPVPASVEPPAAELAVAPEPAAPAASAEALGGRHGLHLVSTGNDAALVQVVPAAAPPEHTLDLPVLTALVEDPPWVKREQKAWYRDRPMIALALAAIALLAAAAGLRWLAPPPVPVAVPVAEIPLAPATPRADAAALPSFAVPALIEEPAPASLSFPPIEVAPVAVAADPPARGAARSRAVPPARTVSATPRPVPKPREIRETVSPPPAACTSNMAALGFCTLPPAAAME
jgi:hypothetical protein